MAEQPMNIYQKLAKARKQVEVMKKDTKAYNYNYTKEESILAKLTVFMDKYGLSLIPGIVPGTMSVNPYNYSKTRSTKDGKIYEEKVNEIIVSADMTWTWVNNDNPEERIVIPWAMTGQQSDSSQSFGAGLTYSSRYFLLKYFSISTSDDDPDKFRGKQKEAMLAEDRLIAEQIIRAVDVHVKSYLAKNPADRDELIKLITKFVKSGNYFEIKEPFLAAKLLEAVQTKYPMKEES
jgi:hypothetical protein